jgi:UDP-glucose 4-epimerase
VGHRSDAIDLRVGDAADPDLLRAVIGGADVIFPVHGRPGVQAGEEHPSGDLDIHAASHLTLLELMRTTSSTARVIYPGSRLQYGVPTELPVPESHAMEPNSVYGIHKVLAERYYLHYFRVHGVAATSIRISVAYGPFQDTPGARHGIVGKFIGQASRGEVIKLHGGGRHVRDFLYIDDLLDLFLAGAAAPGALGRTFNAGGGVGISFTRLAEVVTAVVGRGQIASVPWPTEAARTETGDFVADISAAQEVLGWVPRTSLTDGIEATWASVSVAGSV